MSILDLIKKTNIVQRLGNSLKVSSPDLSGYNLDGIKQENKKEPILPMKGNQHWQFDRIYCVTAALQDGTGIFIEGKKNSTGLNMSFDIQKDLSEKTNKSTIKLYNLSDKTIKFLEGKDVMCLLEVGYSENEGLKRIFVGFITNVVVSRSRGDTEIELKIEDGALPIRNTTVSLAYNGNVSRRKILEDIATCMGVSLEIAEDCDFSNTLNNYSYIGGPEKILNEICNGIDLEWSMQNGILQVIKQGGNMYYKGFTLNSKTGLIGIPKKKINESRQTDNKSSQSKQSGKRASKKNEKKAGWSAICLLNPALVPGDVVRVESKMITGWFQIESLHHKGDYSGNEWYTEMELIAIEDKDENTQPTIIANTQPLSITPTPSQEEIYDPTDTYDKTGYVDGYNGNIDLTNRPQVKNEDGSISTVYSATITDKNTGEYVIIPTVIDDNNPRIVSEEEAANYYYYTNTPRYLGKYNDLNEAEAMAEKIHLQQKEYYKL